MVSLIYMQETEIISLERESNTSVQQNILDAIFPKDVRIQRFETESSVDLVEDRNYFGIKSFIDRYVDV